MKYVNSENKIVVEIYCYKGEVLKVHNRSCIKALELMRSRYGKSLVSADSYFRDINGPMDPFSDLASGEGDIRFVNSAWTRNGRKRVQKAQSARAMARPWFFASEATRNAEINANFNHNKSVWTLTSLFGFSTERAATIPASTISSTCSSGNISTINEKTRRRVHFADEAETWIHA